MREFNTKVAEGEYSITFNTDDEKAFEQVQTLCRILIDGKDGGAIPIEWIEKWLDKTTGTRDGEDISQLPEQLKFAIEMINLMEMEWEKENEKSSISD